MEHESKNDFETLWVSIFQRRLLFANHCSINHCGWRYGNRLVWIWTVRRMFKQLRFELLKAILQGERAAVRGRTLWRIISNDNNALLLICTAFIDGEVCHSMKLEWRLSNDHRIRSTKFSSVPSHKIFAWTSPEILCVHWLNYPIVSTFWYSTYVSSSVRILSCNSNPASWWHCKNSRLRPFSET